MSISEEQGGSSRALMGISEEQGGSGHPRAALEMESPVVARPRQQQPRVPIIFSPERPKYNRPLVRCFLISCILLWAPISIAGISVLIVFGVYQPKKPKLHISDATLNSGYVHELTVPGRPSTGLALKADLAVLAVVYSNNSKIDILLQSMELDLYFKGHMIASQMVLPAPVRKEPHGFVLGYVHFVANEVELPRDDAEVWTNATAQGRPVVLKITGRFHTKLYFGPLLRITFLSCPHCTLWFDPPPRGHMIKASC